jgi:hypothetical protein
VHSPTTPQIATPIGSTAAPNQCSKGRSPSVFADGGNADTASLTQRPLGLRGAGKAYCGATS